MVSRNMCLCTDALSRLSNKMSIWSEQIYVYYCFFFCLILNLVFRLFKHLLLFRSYFISRNPYSLVCVLRPLFVYVIYGLIVLCDDTELVGTVNLLILFSVWTKSVNQPMTHAMAPLSAWQWHHSWHCSCLDRDLAWPGVAGLVCMAFYTHFAFSNAHDPPDYWSAIGSPYYRLQCSKTQWWSLQANRKPA